MKKQLLLGSALLIAISAYPQQHRRVFNPAVEMTPAAKESQTNKAFEGNKPSLNAPTATGSQQQPSRAQRAASTSTSSASWQALSGSANPLGVLVSTQRPLQYNESLNAVSFIHRKSPTYKAINPIPNTNAATGVIVSMVSSDRGATWDSTCVWNNNANTGRYPQGLIYNPAGNTSFTDAYVVASGPALPYNPASGGSNWSGNFFASKQILAASTPTTIKNSPGTNTLFIASTPPYGVVEKVDFARYEMVAPANGKIYLAGILYNDVNATGSGTRGFRIIEGSYANTYTVAATQYTNVSNAKYNIVGVGTQTNNPVFTIYAPAAATYTISQYGTYTLNANAVPAHTISATTAPGATSPSYTLMPGNLTQTSADFTFAPSVGSYTITFEDAAATPTMITTYVSVGNANYGVAPGAPQTSTNVVKVVNATAPTVYTLTGSASYTMSSSTATTPVTSTATTSVIYSTDVLTPPTIATSALIPGASAGFSWKSWDTLSVNNPAAPHSFSVELQSDNSPAFFSDPHMSWNEAGTIGYFWSMGVPAGHVTGVNSGFQPMVWKYDATTSTPTWVAVPFLDFTKSGLGTVIEHIDVANEDHSANFVPGKLGAYYPSFSTSEDWDGIVDVNNNLHIFATVFGVNDTVDVEADGHNGYQIEDETYTWNFEAPGLKPYLYDFTYTGAAANPWKAMLIDSLQTESPDTRSGFPGYELNPWSNLDGGGKQGVNARLQMSRTTDGKYILYSWVDSDVNFTKNGKYWNHIPNMKVRAYNVSKDSLYPQSYDLTTENDLVRDQAFFHYVSPKFAKISEQTSFPYKVVMELPMTVTTNSVSPEDGEGATHISDNPVTHYYSTAQLEFYMIVDGIKENSIQSAQSSVIYPNPAKHNATLAIDLKDNSKVEVGVYNLIGEQVKSVKTAGQIGMNKVNIDLNGLRSGIYIVNVKVDNATSAKKLIVE